MEVRCERCQTDYDFDESLVTERGVAVKCTQCGHLFTVYPQGYYGPRAAPSPPAAAAVSGGPGAPGSRPSPPSGVAAAGKGAGGPPARTATPGGQGSPSHAPAAHPPVAAHPAGPGASPPSEAIAPIVPPPPALPPVRPEHFQRLASPAVADAWMLRQSGGAIYTFYDWNILFRWAVEGRIGPRDEIARPGGSWRTLSTFPDLASALRMPQDAYSPGAYAPGARLDDGFAMGTLPPGSGGSGNYMSGPYAIGTMPGMPAPYPPGVEPQPPYRTTPQLRAASAQPSAPPPPPARTGQVWSATGQRWHTPPGPGAVRAGTPWTSGRGISPHQEWSRSQSAPHDGYGKNGFEDYLDVVGLTRRRRWVKIALGSLLVLLLAGVAYLYFSPRWGLLNEIWSTTTGGSSAEAPRAGVVDPSPASAAAAGMPAAASGSGAALADGDQLGDPVATAGASDTGAVPEAGAGGPASSGATPGPADAATSVAAATTTLPSAAAAAGAASPGPPAAAALAARGFDGLMGAAYAQLMRNRAELALGLYEQAAALRPGSAEPLTGIGWCHLNQGRAHIAVLKFEKALELNHQFGDAMIGLGKAHRQLGDSLRAREAFQRYLGNHPYGSKASIAKASLEQLAGSN